MISGHNDFHKDVPQKYYQDVSRTWLLFSGHVLSTIDDSDIIWENTSSAS